MNVSLKKSLLVSAVAAGLLGMSAAQAAVEANIGVASNYIWRGMTQTQDQAAVSGGLDYSSESGFYAGTWASNVDFGTDADSAGYELDLYGGYGFEVGGVGLDLGYIAYMYPSLDDSDFSEVYANAGIGGLSLGVAFQVDADFTDEDYVYMSIGYDFDLGGDYGMGLYAGNYDFGDDGDDVTHYGLSVGKGDFGFAIDKNDIDGDDDPRVTVSWGTTF